MKPGYGLAYTNLSNSSGTISFNLTFYPSSGTMYAYSTYTVAAINGGCTPATNKTVTVNSSGRTFLVTFNYGGSVDVQIISGPDVNMYSTVALSGTYNIP